MHPATHTINVLNVYVIRSILYIKGHTYLNACEIMLVLLPNILLRSSLAPRYYALSLLRLACNPLCLLTIPVVIALVLDASNQRLTTLTPSCSCLYMCVRVHTRLAEWVLVTAYCRSIITG